MNWKSKFSALILIWMTLLASSCSNSANSLPPGMATACPSPSPIMNKDGTLKLFIPDGPDRDLFEHMMKKTTEEAERAGLSDLKAIVLTGTDLEIRFWMDSIDGLRGIVFKRNIGGWTVTQLEYRDYRGVLNPAKPYPEPDFGWDVFWEKLVSEGILELPDGSCFKDYEPAIDGVGFIIEVNIKGAYRIYSYGNPSLQTPERGVKDPQALTAAKQIMKIAILVFDVNRPRKNG